METTITDQTQTEGNQFTPQQTLPNSTAVLVLGILSIVGCWCLGIVGLALGIIALVLAKNASSLYELEPAKYSEASYKNMNAGKICAIVGTSLSGLYIVAFLVKLLILGATLGGLFSAFHGQLFH